MYILGRSQQVMTHQADLPASSASRLPDDLCKHYGKFPTPTRVSLSSKFNVRETILDLKVLREYAFHSSHREILQLA
jgi:hypothetical protein